MPQAPDAIIEGADLIFRNFAGRAGMYNREGERSFAIKLTKDQADAMVRDGWNVKQLRPREDETEGSPYISVSVSYKNRPPTVILITSRGRSNLDEDLIEMLDNVDIANVDVALRPYDWDVNGNTGRKAYLGALYLTVNENALDLKYGAAPATVDGPMMERTEAYVPSTF